MAQATICDRCGKIYREGRNPPRYSLFDFMRGCDQTLTGWVNGRQVGQPMDLCDKCSFELSAWLAEGGNDFDDEL